LLEFLSEVVEGFFYDGRSIVWGPGVRFDIQFWIVVGAAESKVCYGKFGSDVVEQTLHGGCEIWLGKRPLDAVVEAIAQEVSGAGWRLGVGA